MAVAPEIVPAAATAEAPAEAAAVPALARAVVMAVREIGSKARFDGQGQILCSSIDIVSQTVSFVKLNPKNFANLRFSGFVTDVKRLLIPRTLNSSKRVLKTRLKCLIFERE